jgi:signal transduction histidine kinase
MIPHAAPPTLGDVQVRLAATAAITRARDATGPAWRALAKVAVGPDPVPAPRSPWHRRAALGLAGAAGAAIAAPLVGKIVPHDVPGSLHGIVGQYIPELYLQRIVPAWVEALLVLVALAGVLLPGAMLSRPLLGWRLGWLALLAAPWTEARWLWFNRNFSWEPVQVAVLAVVFIAAGIRNRRGVVWWMWALTVLGWWLSTLAWWLQAGGAKPGLALPAGTIFLTAAAVGADVLGDRDRARRALADATERAEAETARRAVLEERAKIARELHDAVAHHLSLIAVRADAAPYRLAGLASEARAEFSDLGETAREAMTEMRRLLGVLRTGQAAEHAPQPQFADLPELVSAARGAGLAVELTRHGPVSALPAAVGNCAFRIVQESLSNAGRHAPGAAISVGVEVEPSIVRLKISNGPPALARNSTTAVNGRGHGLAGMRERVTLLGGAFSAGPTAGGGFAVAAELPTGEPA